MLFKILTSNKNRIIMIIKYINNKHFIIIICNNIDKVCILRLLQIHT